MYKPRCSYDDDAEPISLDLRAPVSSLVSARPPSPVAVPPRAASRSVWKLGLFPAEKVQLHSGQRCAHGQRGKKTSCQSLSLFGATVVTVCSVNAAFPNLTVAINV